MREHRAEMEWMRAECVNELEWSDSINKEGGTDGETDGGMNILTGVLEHMNLHLHQGKGLSETVRHRRLLLLKNLCYLQWGTEGMLGCTVVMIIIHVHTLTDKCLDTLD